MDPLLEKTEPRPRADPSEGVIMSSHARHPRDSIRWPLIPGVLVGVVEAIR